MERQRVDNVYALRLGVAGYNADDMVDYLLGHPDLEELKELADAHDI